MKRETDADMTQSTSAADTAAMQTASARPLAVDWSFCKSPTGILFIIQVVCSLMALILACSWRGSYGAGHVLFIIADLAVLVASSAIFAARLVKLDDFLSRNFMWPIIFACYSGPAALLTVVFSCIMVGVAKGSSLLKAAGVFGLFTWNALLICFLFHFKPLWDKRQQQKKAVHGTATASRDEESEASDDWSDEERSAGPTTSPVSLTHATTFRSSAVYSPVEPFPTASVRATPAVYASTTQPVSSAASPH